MGRLLALQANIRQGRRVMTVANTSACNDRAIITILNSFKVWDCG